MPLIDPSTGQPDSSGVMVNISVKSYALANYAGIPVGLRDKFAHEPLFPKFALVLFDRMLGLVKKGMSAQDMLDAGVMKDLSRTFRDPFKFAYDAHKGYWAHHNSLGPDVL